MTITDHDVDVMARTAFGEARGEGLDGMVAVCWVILNRAQIALRSLRRQFGDGSIASACLAPDQFSCWNPSDPNRPYIKMAGMGNESFRLAYLASLGAITGHFTDPTQGATGYWNPEKASPAWAEGKDYVSIGHHRFVKDI